MPMKKVFLLTAFMLLPFVAKSTCWSEASRLYGIPVQVLKAVAKTESGLNHKAINRNDNGTTDIGLMQINSSWLPDLKKRGIEENDLYNPCINLKTGAWILSNNAKNFGWNWEAIGAYNVGCKKISKEQCASRRNKYSWKIYTALNATKPIANISENNKKNKPIDSFAQPSNSPKKTKTLHYREDASNYSNSTIYGFDNQNSKNERTARKIMRIDLASATKLDAQFDGNEISDSSVNAEVSLVNPSGEE